MPIDLKDLYAKRLRTLRVALGTDDAGNDLSITLKWSPEAYTKQVHAALQEANESKDAFVMAETIIVPLVKEWDLTSDGAPFPITAENVASLGLFIAQAIVAAVTEDFEVPANLKGISGGASPASAAPASSSPSGTAP